MSIVKQLKGLWGVMGTFREITDTLQRPAKMLREAVSIGLPKWDPPPPAPPLPPDQETVDRVMEVIKLGTVHEKEAFGRVMGSWRKITTGAPREPAPEEAPRAKPAPEVASGADRARVIAQGSVAKPPPTSEPS
ncbi:hypothetical protein LCGC14_0768050 [marine sediment metagenome]|uniref:Uncharacterized protein n=1 Tax=marine sediment metagenome TaxID=412755 RepID=A0A0F9Q3C4_9ZZZZ